MGLLWFLTFFAAREIASGNWIAGYSLVIVFLSLVKVSQYLVELSFHLSNLIVWLAVLFF